MRLASRIGSHIVLGAAALFCAPVPVQPVTPADRPTLLLFITIDQLTPLYFERFRPELIGGLARLLDSGAVFVNAHQDHAITETAPGHASTLSGRFPRSTGITRNLLGVNDTESPLIGADDLGASPRRFRGSTLVDWLTARDPKTQALSVSMKDRSAILPIGASKRPIFWYAVNGLFTTSTWYADTLPTWVQAFNARRVSQSWAGKQWQLLADPKVYTEPDSVPIENFGRNFVFPHRIPADSTRAASYFRLLPMMDEAVLQLALAGVNALGLGRGPATDVLAISLSSTDVVGHLFGMESRETHDQILRLDRSLGQFLDSLFRLRDHRRVVIGLTADHGVAPTPELAAKRFEIPPVRVKIGPAFGPVRSAIKAADGDTTAVDFESGAVFIDGSRLGRLTVDQVIGILTEAAMKVPGVARVDRFADFRSRDPSKDSHARRWLHMFPDDMLPAAVVTLTPGSVYQYPLIATHGSAYDYDTHVPLILVGSGFKRGTYSGFVRTVDIAPTLAAVLGVKPTEPLDGKPLTQAILVPTGH